MESVVPGQTGHEGHPLPAAVLWDMDGTLVDTEPYWMAAEFELVEAAGGTWTHEDALGVVGQPLTESARMLHERGGVAGEPLEIVEQLLTRVIAQVRDKGIPWRPGAHELLDALRAAQVPCAMVTMSYRALTDVVLERLPVGTFAAVVTGDEVTHGKPHPEPYLTAARLLGVEPGACVALEDSPPGVASAEAAGVPTLAVPLQMQIPAAPGRSRTGDLTRVTPATLGRIASGEVLDDDPAHPRGSI